MLETSRCPETLIRQKDRIISTGTVSRLATQNLSIEPSNLMNTNHHCLLLLMIMKSNVINHQKCDFTYLNKYHEIEMRQNYILYFRKPHIFNDTFCSASPNHIQHYKNKQKRFIKCSYLAAKSFLLAAEAPSRLLSSWTASGPDCHSDDFELPVGLWFVQKTDLHLLANEETTPPSVNQSTKQSSSLLLSPGAI